jgi:hypothetical protein
MTWENGPRILFRNWRCCDDSARQSVSTHAWYSRPIIASRCLRASAAFPMGCRRPSAFAIATELFSKKRLPDAVHLATKAKPSPLVNPAACVPPAWLLLRLARHYRCRARRRNVAPVVEQSKSPSILFDLPRRCLRVGTYRRRVKRWHLMVRVATLDAAK